MKRNIVLCAALAAVISLSGARVTSDALWQNGQRRLQPCVKSVAAQRPGKSSSVSLRIPSIIISYHLTAIFYTAARQNSSA